MNVSTIDYLELYVEDLAATGELFRTGYGLRRLGTGGPETGLVGVRSVLLGSPGTTTHPGIRLLLTQGLASDHPATRYVERHGDGVAVLGLQTGDPAAAGATVTGPGSLCHRLVGPDHWPAGIEPATDELPSDGLLQAVDHLALCVPPGALDPTAAHYQDTFGFQQIFEERVEVGAQAMDSKVVQSPSGQVTLTIVAPDPTTAPGQLDDFLRSHDGAGVQHVAFATSDIVTAVRTLGSRGVRFLATPGHYYDTVEQRLGRISRSVAALRDSGILVDRDHWGEMFQIFTRSPFSRRTTFFELIERRGALTFGSNNIKALYEANERARDATTVQRGG